MKVLVVDDDRTSLEMMGSVLQDAGFEPVLRSSPIGATQAIRQEGVGAVVLDLNMPSIPGDRLARLIRGNSRWRELPVILVSGAVDLAAIAEGLEGVSYLEKERVGAELAGHVAWRIGSPRLIDRASRPPSPRRLQLRQQLIEGFLRTTPGISDVLRRLLARAPETPNPVESYVEGRALLHQIKGEAQVLGLLGIAELVAALESAAHHLTQGLPHDERLRAAFAQGLDLLRHVPATADEAMAFDASTAVEGLRRATEGVHA